jgi:hypothetical protein
MVETLSLEVDDEEAIYKHCAYFRTKSSVVAATKVPLLS